MKAYKKWKTNEKKIKFAFEYLPCKDLYELAKEYQDKKLPFELVRFYAVETIKALNYLKLNKILHRDIKPANILLDHHFHIKLADFGSSLKHDENNKDCKYNRLYELVNDFRVKFKAKLQAYNETIQMEKEENLQMQKHVTTCMKKEVCRF